MKEEKIHQILEEKYTYSKESPTFVSMDGRYKIFAGQQKEISIPVTIKILHSINDPSLSSYLSKLKSTKSEQVIKIYQIINEANSLVIITEQVIYGTVATALNNCKKLDENDALYVSKYLLTGYMDTARNGADWYGTLNDIEITQTGIKLSWNNTMPINAETSNTFREVLEQISIEKKTETEQRLLPFPESKQLKELFRLSESSASEISLSPIMKKKEKYLKKKFKEYLLIRETKLSGEYFDQTVYLGVSKEHGFVRIKAYKKGVIHPTILELNKSKNTFTKIYETVEEGLNTYLFCGYSNDGTLQSYVQRLKGAGIQLKEEQIQFFFFSMMQPLKAIQESSIKSLNTSLHIKNIYIQSGIPKIGQPIPINEEVKEKFRERADVPDFYHKAYKQNPQTSDPSYDTYALGVLLHKLMFTQYPIFPENNKVKIPITPAFSPRLKKTLQIFLDEGGKLSEIEKKIEVSQMVLKQVKKNKEILLNVKKQQEKKLKNEKKNFEKIFSQDDDDIEKQNKGEEEQKEEQKEALTQNEEEVEDDCFECFVKLQMADHTVQPEVESLQESPYKRYRLCTKFFCFLLVYILLMYMFYIRDNIWMLMKQGSLQRMNITISTTRYEIITQERSEFYLKFNQTSRAYSDLVWMGCMINSSEENYWSTVQPNSWKWIGYLCGGLGMLLVIILLKSVLIFKFDYIKAKYNYQHNLSNFNYSNYFIMNLLLASLINQHFHFFNTIFYTTLPACMGSKNSKLYSTVEFMLAQDPKFLYIHLPVVSGMLLVTLLHFLILYKTDSVNYSKIFNPIMLFTPFLLAYWIIVRIGVLPTFFYPSALNDTQSIIKNYFTSGDYIGIIGIVPEILFLIEFFINKLIDMFYWLLIDKKRRVMIQQTSTENIQLYQ